MSYNLYFFLSLSYSSPFQFELQPISYFFLPLSYSSPFLSYLSFKIPFKCYHFYEIFSELPLRYTWLLQSLILNGGLIVFWWKTVIIFYLVAHACFVATCLLLNCRILLVVLCCIFIIILFNFLCDFSLTYGLFLSVFFNFQTFEYSLNYPFIIDVYLNFQCSQNIFWMKWNPMKFVQACFIS